LVGRPRHRWRDYVNNDFKETGWEKVDMKLLSKKTDQWQRIVNMVNAENFMTGCGTASFSGKILLHGVS
jgi:hypothetical protein